ncbi:MAG TPA: PEP-CTERM sorting domain-containing protein [Verrucomicrobiae bacterium]|nr:PEP-CTERM sorting domain-containing protein [Verrucomicrobiae bacterium]
MKSRLKTLIVTSFAGCALMGATVAGFAQSTVSVNPANGWIGYMNWFDLNMNYVSGGAWGTADLPTGFSGGVLTLGPNVNVYNPGDAYWVNGDGSGAKIMDASFYVEDASLAGSPLTFSGNVLANTLVSPYNSVAFIKEFTTSYALVQSKTAPLVGGQPFSVNLTSAPGNIIQYGFETMGPDANPATVAGLGNVQVQAVPEPSSLALLVVGLGIPFCIYRKQKNAVI